MSSNDAFTAAVSADFARTGDTTILMRGAYIAGLNYGAEAGQHIARIAMSDLVDPRTGLLTIALLNVSAILRDGEGYEFNSKVRQMLEADSALREIADAAEANHVHSSSMSHEASLLTSERDRKLYAIFTVLRPLAIDELKSRDAASSGVERGAPSDVRRVSLNVER